MSAAKTRRKAAPAPDVEPVTIRSRDLADFLADALLFTDRSGFLPTLDAALLTVEDGNLVAASTDRYMLGIRSMPWTGRPTFEPFLLDGGDATDIIKILRGRRDNRPVDLAIGERLVLTFGNVTVTCIPKEGTFPKYRELLNTARSDKPSPSVGTVALNPRYIAKFGRLSMSSPMKVVTTDPLKPVIVTIGDHFTGMLMPVRLEEYANEVAA